MNEINKKELEQILKKYFPKITWQIEYHTSSKFKYKNYRITSDNLNWIDLVVIYGIQGKIGDYVHSFSVYNKGLDWSLEEEFGDDEDFEMCLQLGQEYLQSAIEENYKLICQNQDTKNKAQTTGLMKTDK